jgi:DNA-binding response OmpR family regulator
VVEDEALVAIALEDMLVELGCAVVGPALRLKAGLDLAAAEQLDGAILDINLGTDDRSFPVAELLTARSVPFLFATGYGGCGLEPPFVEAPVLAKPYCIGALRKALDRILRRSSG